MTLTFVVAVSWHLPHKNKCLKECRFIFTCSFWLWLCWLLTDFQLPAILWAASQEEDVSEKNSVDYQSGGGQYRQVWFVSFWINISNNWIYVIFFFLFLSPSHISGVYHFGWDFCVYDCFLIQPLRQSHSIFMDGACWVCFCCQHSSVKDMNVRIFWVHAMECTCAQARPFILSSESVFGECSQNPCSLQGKNPLYLKNSPQRRIEPMTLHQAG